MYIVVILAIVFIFLAWKRRPRRWYESGFKFVYINQDGTARELSPEEQTYLTQEFVGGDGNRPYIKSYYKSRDGWGSISGYIKRHRVPAKIIIQPVNPNYDTEVKKIPFNFVEMHHVAGYIIEENTDGSIKCAPNPAISRKKRLELARNYQLEQQQNREGLARIDRRSLSEGELKILGLIQKHYGVLNTKDEIIFDDKDKAVIWVKDETGDTILMVNLTNLAAWRDSGVISSEEDLLSDWLHVKLNEDK